MLQHLLGLRGGSPSMANSMWIRLRIGRLLLRRLAVPTGLVDELRKRLPGMMTLVALAITVAYVYSALVVFGYPGACSSGNRDADRHHAARHWIEMRSVLGASRRLEQLVRLLPPRRIASGPTARRGGAARSAGGLVTGCWSSPAKDPDRRRVVQGRTSVNQSMLTGESQPVEKGEGDEVIGGAVNGEGAITIEVRRTGAEAISLR